MQASNCHILQHLGVLALLGMVLASCQKPEADTPETIARVGLYNLFADDLSARMPEGLSTADSARMADQIVRDWVLDKALLTLAEENLPPEQKDVQKQLEEYKNSLLIYAYERAYLNQKLDTAISQNELMAYYEENKGNFILRSNLLKIKFVKLSIDAPRLNKVEDWLASNSDSDFDKLYEYCRSYADNYYFDENTWLYLEEVMKEIPIPADDVDNFLTQKTYFSFKSDEYAYFVRIYDYKLKGDIAPFETEQTKVRDFILNRRRAELLSRMREDLVTNGIASGDIFIRQ